MTAIRKGKAKILVTGANGFIGSHLVSRLRREGFVLYTLSQSKDRGDQTFYGSVSDWNFVNRVFQKAKFFACYHLAGHSLVEEGTDNPRITLQNNIEGTWNILEAGRMYGVKRMIVASTIHIYGDNPRVPYKEYDIPRPSRIYETSKTCADIIAQSYITTYGSSIFIPRFCNIYGPGDLNFERLIPKTIKSIIVGRNPVIWGGNAMRDYLYIDDAVEAYMRLLDIDMKKDANHIFNFGAGNLISVRDIVTMLIRLSGKEDIKIQFKKDQRKDEIITQYASWSKAKRLLGWTPQVSLAVGLKMAIDWYLDYFKQQEYDFS